MSDDEQPVANRAAILRTSQACQQCRSLKTRCLPSNKSGTCQRCHAAKRNCVWAEAPRRARKLRAPSRISQVEQKIDGLVASLVNKKQPTVDTEAAPAPASVEAECIPASHPRPAAPGAWLPFPASFEQRHEIPGEPPSQTDGEDNADRQYIAMIRSIHNFSDHDEAEQNSDSLFKASKRPGQPLKDSIVEDLLNTGKADALLEGYRKMADSFPFVPMAESVSARQFHQHAPMLFLAIITAASWKDHQCQLALDSIYRQELANRTIVRPQKNLSLVQSLLVYLSWYHFVFSHKTQQIFFLHHLVVGLALDIGLHRDFQPTFFSGHQKPQQVDSKEKRIRQRTFLGCYYLSSMVSAALQKPNLLKHNSSMTEWAQGLRTYREFETDEVLVHLISLRQLDDQVQETLFTGAAVDAPLTDARVLMYVRFLESQLDTWRRDSKETKGSQRMLLLSHAYTDMVLHTIPLRPTSNCAQSPANDGTYVNMLHSALEAAKRFFDTLLAFPVSDYHLISFSEWIRLPAAMMTVAKICIPTEAHTVAGWDVKAAQDLVRLEMCIEALCYRFQNQSTYDKVKQPRFDFWRAMQFVTDSTRAWYVRKINPQSQTDTSNLPTPSTTGANHGLCSGYGALPTSHGCEQSQFADGAVTDFSDMDLGLSTGDGANDPLAFIRAVDFDMEQFFDMGIWGDEAYTSMGFGGSTSF